MEVKKKLFIFAIAAIVSLAAAYAFLEYAEGPRIPGQYDKFAECLRDKGVVMYGADWCPHCQNEKRAFGESFKYVNYVECPKNPKICLDAGIESYPTWIFADGRKLEGEQGLEKLAKESGCNIEP